MASWRVEPERISGEWHCYRQVSPEWAPLYHAAGEPVPSQSSGRWHRAGEGYAPYMGLEPLGAWAEVVRYEGIRGHTRAAQYRRRLWLFFVREHDIADLSTFGSYEACGLDPALAVGAHENSQTLADDLRHAGFRGVLSPSAALVGASNLTLFGRRFEKVMLGGLERWPTTHPGLKVPCSLVVEGNPPEQLTSETTFEDLPHAGYRDWLRAAG
ncbi:MAG: RES family NAD+ phosphorylase [Thermoleophilaceae bacterium]